MITLKGKKSYKLLPSAVGLGTPFVWVVRGHLFLGSARTKLFGH